MSSHVKKGICINSTFLKVELNLNGPTDCITACQNYDGCNYVTFKSDDTNVCFLFQTCSELDTDACPTCSTDGAFEIQAKARDQLFSREL